MTIDMTSHSSQKRPCCRLLKELSKIAHSLKNPHEVSQALEVISQHCVLVKLMGESAVKWDLSKSQCYLAFHPDEAEKAVNAMSIVQAANHKETYFDALMFHLQGILAHNEKLKQISDKNPHLQAEIREGEKKYGSVPQTNLLKENKTQNTLQAGDLLKAHPLLNHPQMDGASPKNTADPKQHPDAQENVERLQHQLELKPGQKLAATYKAPPPTLTR